jgi:rhodanese-related sulfurtransferase
MRRFDCRLRALELFVDNGARLFHGLTNRLGRRLDVVVDRSVLTMRSSTLHDVNEARLDPPGAAADLITADELRAKLDRGDDFVLIDALAPMVYAHSHLPGSINMPPVAVDPARVEKRIPDPNMEIVVYCANSDCDDSVATAQRLQALGYANVRHYAGGKDEWRALGFPLERAGRPYVPD